ncbi:hypothetical protein AFLA70_57g004081 [Aspergillus flavus AF70]|nr:hypothetical protein AFLA70_57g004081 [Aspergillus flavus AF70]
MQWSNAKPKRTTWSLTGINLQLSATTGSPLQVGGSLGLTFEREVTTLPFDTNDGYLECLKSSMAEQVFLYDVSESRAWFVPLIAVLHQMLLAYYQRIPAEFRKGTIPLAQRPYTGADSSFRCLQGSGSVVVEGSEKDRLTVRDLILGFSANVAKAGLHPAGRSEIYGYEFMDIVTDSPRSELKATSVDKEASAWTSLLSHVKCLFCSQLGDVIVDRNSYGRQLLCNRLPVGLDWLAASMHSLDTLNTRQGGKPTGIVRLLSSEHYWSMTGSPFQDCNHSNASHTSCWDTGALLQEVKRGRLPTEEDEEMNDVRNGAVVFGRGKRPVCRISGADHKAKKAVPGEVTEPSVRLSTLKAISRKHRDSSMSLSSGTVTEE